MSEDFYIGYLSRMSKRSARYVKLFAAAAFLAAISLALISWYGQMPFANSIFEFGNVKSFEGTIQADPIPFLLVEQETKTNGLPLFKRYPLVGEGKHGAGEEVSQADGRKVNLKGTRISRDGLEMIEVVSGSVEVLPNQTASTSEARQDLGAFTLNGEIVDSKCYLGVMNPGQSKPHKDCAIACLRGGIPPLFIVRDNAGNVSELWLLSEKGESVNKLILDFVAEPIEISGRVLRLGDQLFLEAEISKIRRLP